jgi:hypothetical protein
MTVAQVKSKVKRKIDKLSGKKLKELDAFLDTINAPQEPRDTRYKPSFIARLRRAERQIAQGKTITLDELKKKHGL